MGIGKARVGRLRNKTRRQAMKKMVFLLAIVMGVMDGSHPRSGGRSQSILVLMTFARSVQIKRG